MKPPKDHSGDYYTQMKRPKISAVIPCLNEEKTLPICIAKIQRKFDELGVIGEVVVGDNGSIDKSVEIASAMGAKVVNQKIRGYGAALKAAIEAAEGNYIIMADADDSYDWSNLEPFVNKLDNGYDFVIGNRFKGSIFPGAMPFLHRYFGNPILSGISRKFYNVPIGDFHCGMRAFTRKAYEKMSLQTEGMEFATEMVVRAARCNLRISEVPINLYPDKRTRKPHLRTFRDGWRHLRFIMTYAPNYLYLAPGGLFFILGALLMILLIKGPVLLGGFYLGSHFMALGLLLTLIGINIISQGIIAKVYLVSQTPGHEDIAVIWLKKKFTLERGLFLGGAILSAGLSIDAVLLFKRMLFGGSMESSIHVAFFGTGLVTIGINLLFSSFLINMFLDNKTQNDRKQNGERL